MDIIQGIDRPKRRRGSKGRVQARRLTKPQDLALVIDRKWVKATPVILKNPKSQPLATPPKFGPNNYTQYCVLISGLIEKLGSDNQGITGLNSGRTQLTSPSAIHPQNLTRYELDGPKLILLEDCCPIKWVKFNSIVISYSASCQFYSG